MHSSIVVVCVVILANAFAYPTFSANDDGTVSAFLDPEDYDAAEEIFSGMQAKRFWSPHPSDYNPLRRPVPVPRGSKRDEVVYHPLPRHITTRQRGHGDEEVESAEGPLEVGRNKKQTRPTTLIFRLGSWGLRRKGDKNTVPTPAPQPGV